MKTIKKSATVLALSIFLLGLLAGAARAAGAAETRAAFGYPVDGEAWYSIRAAFAPPDGMAGAACKVVRVEVNKARCRDFVLFQDGKEPATGEIQMDRPFEVKVRFSWLPRTVYTVDLMMEDIKSAKKVLLSWSGTSPSGKGYWDPAWKNYLSLILSEENGFARTDYPVHATVGLISNYIRSADEIRVVRAELEDGDAVYREVPSQVTDLVTWNDPKILSIEEKDAKTGKPVVRYHPTTSLGLGFLADLKPKTKATYLVFFNNPGAPKPRYPSDLRVKKGPNLGRTIDNAFYQIVLQEKSGAIYEILEKTTGIRLEHKLETNGAIQWNPDVFSPPHTWYHSSDWTDPRTRESTGPVFYSITMKGALPYPKGVNVGISYRFYAGSPIVMVETITQIDDDLFVMALRNGEFVFNKAVFTKAAFKRDGKAEILDFSASKLHPDHAAVLRPDTPWVSLFDERKGIGFASLFLDLSTPNLNGGQASLEQPFIYIENGPWYYVSRGLVYSFATNNQTRMLPVKAGSVYYERNAWITFPYPKGQTLGSYLDRYFNMLKSPVAIKEDMETFAESPEGWVVPILTEPFEEGVKSALGGKERKK
ncbi:MAG: hypothetical protein ABR951_11330 [Candidatus Aminicenantales bacterium]|jgi:hypothetical protein